MDLLQKRKQRKKFQVGEINTDLQEWEYKQQYANNLRNNPAVRVQAMEAQLPGLYTRPQQVFPDTAPINNIQLNSPFNSQAVYAPTLSQYVGSTVPLEAGIGALNLEYDNYFENTAPTIKIGDALTPDIKRRDAKNQEYADRIKKLADNKDLSSAQRMRKFNDVVQDYQNDKVVRSIQQSVQNRAMMQKEFRDLVDKGFTSKEAADMILSRRDRLYAEAGGIGDNPDNLGAYNIYQMDRLAKTQDYTKFMDDKLKGWNVNVNGQEGAYAFVNGQHIMKGKDGSLLKILTPEELRPFLRSSLINDTMMMSSLKQDALVNAEMYGLNPDEELNRLINETVEYGVNKGAFTDIRQTQSRDMTTNTAWKWNHDIDEKRKLEEKNRLSDTVPSAFVDQRTTMPKTLDEFTKKKTLSEFIQTKTGLTPTYDSDLIGEGIIPEVPDYITKSDGSIVKRGETEFNKLLAQIKDAEKIYNNAPSSALDAGKNLENSNELYAKIVQQVKSEINTDNNAIPFPARVGDNAESDYSFNLLNNTKPTEAQIYEEALNRLNQALDGNTAFNYTKTAGTEVQRDLWGKRISGGDLINQLAVDGDVSFIKELEDNYSNYSVYDKKKGKNVQAKSAAELLNNVQSATWNPYLGAFEGRLSSYEAIKVPGASAMRKEANIFMEHRNAWMNNFNKSKVIDYELAGIQQKLVQVPTVDAKGRATAVYRPISGNTIEFYNKIGEMSGRNPADLKAHAEQYGGIPIEIFEEIYPRFNTSVGQWMPKNQMTMSGQTPVPQETNQYTPISE